MKRVFRKSDLVCFLLIFGCSHISVSQTTDTIVGRCPDYYYYGWYDECLRYESDSNNFALDGFIQPAYEGTANNNIVFLEQYSPGPISIKGVAVMVAIDPGQDPVARPYMPPVDSLKMPEYVYIFQGSSPIPGLPQLFFPQQMMLLDSVRWDTAAPKLMSLPRDVGSDTTTDTARWFYCYVYEAIFDSAVTVEDTFYISGTFRNNVLDYTYDTVYDEQGNIDHVRSIGHFRHHPTDYVVVRDLFSDDCEKCPVRERLIFGELTWSTEWLRVYNWNWFLSGPFLPIVDF